MDVYIAADKIENIAHILSQNFKASEQHIATCLKINDFFAGNTIAFTNLHYFN